MIFNLQLQAESMEDLINLIESYNLEHTPNKEIRLTKCEQVSISKTIKIKNSFNQNRMKNLLKDKTTLQ